MGRVCVRWVLTPRARKKGVVKLGAGIAIDPGARYRTPR